MEVEVLKNQFSMPQRWAKSIYINEARVDGHTSITLEQGDQQIVIGLEDLPELISKLGVLRNHYPAPSPLYKTAT